MVIQDFDQSEQQPWGEISIKTRFDKIGNFVDFLVVDMDAAYNMLLGHLRMHKNAAILSTYYQRVSSHWGEPKGQ